MGGTYVMDHAFSCNRFGIRSKKWGFCLLTFYLQSSLYNSYLIYCKTPNGATAYLDFLHPVVQTYLISYGKSAKGDKCCMETRVLTKKYQKKSETIKLVILLTMLKKEQDVSSTKCCSSLCQM